MTTRDPLDYGWWLASRSAGLVAYALLSAAVLLGLAMALRLGLAAAAPRARAGCTSSSRCSRSARPPRTGCCCSPTRGCSPGLRGLLVPFAAEYRPLWTGLGVLAGYLAAGLSLTYYARRRLGVRRWRQAHRFIPVAWALAAVHVAGAGTDAVSLWLQVPLALSAALVLALLAERLLRRAAPGAAGRRARACPAGGARAASGARARPGRPPRRRPRSGAAPAHPTADTAPTRPRSPGARASSRISRANAPAAAR